MTGGDQIDERMAHLGAHIQITGDKLGNEPQKCLRILAGLFDQVVTAADIRERPFDKLFDLRGQLVGSAFPALPGIRRSGSTWSSHQ